MRLSLQQFSLVLLFGCTTASAEWVSCVLGDHGTRLCREGHSPSEAIENVHAACKQMGNFASACWINRTPPQEIFRHREERSFSTPSMPDQPPSPLEKTPDELRNDLAELEKINREISQKLATETNPDLKQVHILSIAQLNVEMAKLSERINRLDPPAVARARNEKAERVKACRNGPPLACTGIRVPDYELCMCVIPASRLPYGAMGVP